MSSPLMKKMKGQIFRFSGMPPNELARPLLFGSAVPLHPPPFYSRPKKGNPQPGRGAPPFLMDLPEALSFANRCPSIAPACASDQQPIANHASSPDLRKSKVNRKRE